MGSSKAILYRVEGYPESYYEYTYDENGRIIKYIVIDPQTGECKRSYYTCYEYKAIEVPVEYAALAQGLAGYFDHMYF